MSDQIKSVLFGEKNDRYAIEMQLRWVSWIHSGSNKVLFLHSYRGLEKSTTPHSPMAPSAGISSCITRRHGPLLSSHFSRFEHI